MPDTNSWKKVMGKIMMQLQEAGEEDICSLLNQIQTTQPHYGSGEDLAEYLKALSVLEDHEMLQVREYRTWDKPGVNGTVLTGTASRPPTAFHFDSAEGYWKWKRDPRQLVVLPHGVNGH
jgi:hypothetical protein